MNEPSPAEQFEAWLAANPPAPRVRPEPGRVDYLMRAALCVAGLAMWGYLGWATGAAMRLW